MSCSIPEPKSASTCDYQPEDDGSKEFKVPVPHELRGKTRPRDKAINKFIRDCVACLQAHHGTTKISAADGLSAAKRIVERVPISKVPKPPSFHPDKQFPYWVSKHTII